MGALTYRLNYGTVVAICNLDILALKLKLVIRARCHDKHGLRHGRTGDAARSVFHIMALRQWSWILFTSNLLARLRVGPI
jgi:hypothetical protein